MEVSNSTLLFTQHYLRQVPFTIMDVLSLLYGAIWTFLQRGWIQEGLKLMLFGTAMEGVRGIWKSVSSQALQRLFIEATFVNGDFCFDWIDTYLKAHNVWENSTSVRVLSIVRPGSHALAGDKLDIGHPRPVYQSTPDQPELWRWKGHWIKVRKLHGDYEYRTGTETGGSITLSVYSWKRWVIKELIEEARTYYLTKSRPQLMQTQFPAGKAPSVVIATFTHPDQAYDWMLGFLGSLNAWKDVRQVEVIAKKSTSAHYDIESSAVGGRLSYMPTAEYPQLLQWNGYWVQVTRDKGSPHWRTGREEGGKLTVILHHTQREVMDELVEAARLHSMQGARHYVTVHLADQHGTWAQKVNKARRRLETLILPTGTAEDLLSDAREFLVSEKWYKNAGVPYRRGYLLHGIPGAGKTSTIHAIASELMLPIYAISLANKGMDDSTLLSLVAQTPSECILSIEDIDCAFPEPRRAEDDDEGDGGNGAAGGGMEAFGPRTMQMNAMGMPTKASEVTLSGLLNVIDGVWSEEGRLVFATTNHLEKLDPALIRPGRMDVKIHYEATTRDQAQRMFSRFFPPGLCKTAELDEAKISELATQFADSLPESTFSAAALQGYLLLWKNDPAGAVRNVEVMVEKHRKEEAEREAVKEKTRAARRKSLEARRTQDPKTQPVGPTGADKKQDGEGAAKT